METELSSDKMQISRPGNKQELRLWVIDQLTLLAEAQGEPLTPQRLRIYAEDLSDLTLEGLTTAFTRARRELRFFPKIAELRQLAGASDAEQRDAEARAAWQLVTDLLDRHVRSDVHGGYHLVEDPYGLGWKLPELSDRVLSTVRRVGGWRTLKCMTSEDYPFVQKRFYEEYRASDAISAFDPSRLLREAARAELPAGPEWQEALSKETD
jgi:hypothetical protein